MLEIACFEITSAEIALNSVADRIEFCSDFQLGGLTPNIDEFSYLREKYGKPIHVMIRPSSGSFFYSDNEFLKMKKSIQDFKKAGANAFVFGILGENYEIDEEKNKILIDTADGIPCIFHRAIDRTPDLEKSVEKLISLRFKEVLTSGGKKTAIEGKDTIKTLIKNFSSEIKILIGGGVRSTNIAALKNYTLGKYFHSSAILPYETFVNDQEIKKLKEIVF